MADDTQASGGAGGNASTSIVVQDDVRAQFPVLIPLILASESMNDEERSYWIDILPVMTEEQIEQLTGILTNERDQLAAIDAKYAKEIEKVGDEQSIRRIGEERKKKIDERASGEQHSRDEEATKAESLLKEIGEL